MPSTCVVKFDNLTGFYYAGQEVSGMVQLTTTSEKTIRGIEIKVLGYVRTWFYERHGGKHHKHRRLYYAEEKVIDSGGYVIGSEDGSTFTYHPGTYNYNFRCHIPTNVPSSFEGKFGVVRYIVNIKVNRYLAFDNIFKEPFVVILPLDLNFNPKLRMPDSVNESKKYVECCKSGPLSAYLSTPIIGYVPGQTVPYKILIDNETNSDVSNIFVGISQKCFFETCVPRLNKRETEYKIMRKPIDTIRRYSRKEIYDNIVMPPVPSSTIDTTRIILICYRLYLQVDSGCCKKEFTLSIPLTVGVIPIENSFDVPIRPPVFKEAVQLRDDPIGKDPSDGLFFGNQVREYDIYYPVYNDLTTKSQNNW